MNKQNCEDVAYILSVHRPEWHMVEAFFALDERIEPEYNAFEAVQGRDDAVIELTEELLRKHNGTGFLRDRNAPPKKTYAECMTEARKTIYGDDYREWMFER